MKKSNKFYEISLYSEVVGCEINFKFERKNGYGDGAYLLLAKRQLNAIENNPEAVKNLKFQNEIRLAKQARKDEQICELADLLLSGKITGFEALQVIEYFKLI